MEKPMQVFSEKHISTQLRELAELLDRRAQRIPREPRLAWGSLLLDIRKSTKYLKSLEEKADD